MIATFLLAGWVAVTVPWAQSPSFALTCAGTQVAYEETTGVKQTIPWQETFIIDLRGGTYCSQGCAVRKPLSALTSDGLDLVNATGTNGFSVKRYRASTGAIETNTIVASLPTTRFHLAQTGTCQISY